MRINFDKIDGFFRVLDGEIKNLAFFDHRLFDEICDRMAYLMSEKSGVTDSINFSFRKTRIYWCSFLSIEKSFKFRNFILHIKSVVSKNKNEYY